MQREELERYIADVYGTEPDFPWEKYPRYAVYRHAGSRKWFALLMDVQREKLGLLGTGSVEILNVKCDPVLVGETSAAQGIYPAYHMNKANWVSVALDGSADAETIKMLLDRSYTLTAAKPRQRKPYEW